MVRFFLSLLSVLFVAAPSLAAPCISADPGPAVSTPFATIAPQQQRMSPDLAEWPGAPCVTDADCGDLRCCDGVCADSCRADDAIFNAESAQTPRP